jgi:hypothetical protein
VVVAIAVVALVLGLVFVVLSVISHGALTAAVAAIQHGERPGVRGALRAGRSAFWRVLGLGALVVAIAFGLLLALAVPLALMVGGTFALTDAALPRALAVIGAVLVGIAALTLVFLPLFGVGQYALRELVLGGRPVVESLRGGWGLLRANLGPSLLVFLIQQGISLGAGLVVAFALALLAVPAIVVAVAADGALVAVALVATALVLLPLALAGFGAIGTFSHALWTLAYMRMVWRQPPLSERP